MVLKIKRPVREEPNVQHMLERMPKKVADSFSDEQLSHLNTALAGRRWGNHKVDVRGTISLLRSRYYFVLLAGIDKRDLSRTESRIGRNCCAFFLRIVNTWFGTSLYPQKLVRNKPFRRIFTGALGLVERKKLISVVFSRMSRN